MRIISNHKLDDEILTKVLGWKWMAFDGAPTRGAPDYPKERRVRQLLSPKQLKSKEWKAFLEKRNGGDADGTEPLSYAHCSSQGPTIPPRIFILVDE